MSNAQDGGFGATAIWASLELVTDRRPTAAMPLAGQLAQQERRDLQRQLDNFLAEQERRAYQMAYLATHDREEALEIVQDAMFKLVQKYAHKPAAAWGPLFTRILQNRIKNWYRKRSISQRIFSWFGEADEQAGQGGAEAVDSAAPLVSFTRPDQNPETARFMEALERALHGLPGRQQQAFLLRAVHGFDVAETAAAMRCSSGSVKTHYSRALAKLKIDLQAFAR